MAAAVSREYSGTQRGPVLSASDVFRRGCGKSDEALSRFENPARAEIVFSAHSIPMSIIAKGDPYQRQIEETVRLLMARGGWPNPPSSLLPEQSWRQQVVAAFFSPDIA